MTEKATTKVKLGGSASPAEEEVAEEEPLEVEDNLEEDDFEDFEENIQVEDLDPDQQVWPNGPTAGQVIEWKNQFGDIFVSHLTPDIYVLWRTIRRGEYRNHVKNIEALASAQQHSPAELDMISEEHIAHLCTLFPRFEITDFSHGQAAGLASKIAEEVMNASGFMSYEVKKL